MNGNTGIIYYIEYDRWEKSRRIKDALLLSSSDIIIDFFLVLFFFSIMTSFKFRWNSTSYISLKMH
jgi:hypothetical protein